MGLNPEQLVGQNLPAIAGVQIPDFFNEVGDLTFQAQNAQIRRTSMKFKNPSLSLGRFS
ncbi:hypothetical protein [Nostoc sp. UHCC 0252]|uniref:hypothetical protein n=1 Tax=Nostoc sp. UHCC 0252 TaxID=3110241 RepID=UPI002B1FC892|nr:hypothetical protein [Nostoc sp. UHCC 0252]MEA5600208.1 hypothetical protein [Nostoc sp. UHCC 0252]